MLETDFNLVSSCGSYHVTLFRMLFGCLALLSPSDRLVMKSAIGRLHDWSAFSRRFRESPNPRKATVVGTIYYCKRKLVASRGSEKEPNFHPVSLASFSIMFLSRHVQNCYVRYLAKSRKGFCAGEILSSPSFFISPKYDFVRALL